MKKIIYSIIALSALTLTSCDMDVFDVGKDPAEGTTYKSTEGSPISIFLSEDERFSEYVDILRASGLYNALNQSSDGVSFTAFAPTNEAMEEFYKRIGSKVTDVSESYARDFVLYHTVKDSILPDAFIQKSSVTNLAKDNIKIAIDEEHAGQVTLTNSNSTGQLTELGLPASNGRIYVMSKALTPLVETIFDRIEENKEYGIMLQAVKETGWDKQLQRLADTTVVDGKQTITSRNYTFLAVSDETFKKENISDLPSLKQKLIDMNEEPGITPDSLLKAYIGYHVVMSKNTMDAMGAIQGTTVSRLWSTGAKNLVFTMTTDTLKTDIEERYTINADGTATHFIPNKSNVLALNGYVHEVNNMMAVWEPDQQQVVWDFADNNTIKDIVEKAEIEYQPEAAPSKQQKVDISSAFTFTNTESANSNFDYVDYYTTLTPTAKAIEQGSTMPLHNDCVVFNIGNTGTAELTTPTIVRGKYKVELTVIYTTGHSFMRKKSDGSGGTLEITFDDKEKKFVAPYTMVPSQYAGAYTSTLYDEIEFESTQEHVFKFKVKDAAASSNKGWSLQFDTMTFTPIK